MVPSLKFLEVRERFLPVTTAMLRQRMLADPRLSHEERMQLRKLFEMIAARFHFEFRKKLEHVKAVYEPLDPDRETLAPPQGTGPFFGSMAPDLGKIVDRNHGPVPLEAASPALRQSLAEAFEELLRDANYMELPREQIVTCAEHQAQIGLLRVFCRGMRHEQRTFRPWMTPWKKQSETVHVFSRTALLVRLVKQPDVVFLKLFKNVVAEDLEMLLPSVRIYMRLFDKAKVGWSLGGGVATAAWKAFSVAIVSPWVLLGILLGFAGALIQGVSSFSSSRARYVQKLTKNLYFQNLANNDSMLAHLVDSAEAEECKELLLAYYLLYAERNRDFTRQELDRRVERWLKEQFDVDVNFDVSLAVEKLRGKQLLVRRPQTGVGQGAETALKVYDLPSALRRLDKAWDEFFGYNAAHASNEDRMADDNWPAYPEGALERFMARNAMLRIDAGTTDGARPAKSGQGTTQRRA
jgi:Protein of unknown function (DUF3754)